MNELERLFDAHPPGDLTEEEKANWASWDKFMEDSFAEIAAYYESENLVPPKAKLETINGSEKYVVYVYKYEDSLAKLLRQYISGDDFARGTYVANYCGRFFSEFIAGDINPVAAAIEINQRDLLDQSVADASAEVLRTVYNTVAHELFHAIQYRYDDQYSSILACRGRDGPTGHDAVIEGTAEAAAAMATLDKYPGYLSKDTFDAHPTDIGVFPYDYTAFLEAYDQDENYTPGVSPWWKSSQPYRTSSFWRYFAERFGGLRVYDTLFKEGLSEATLRGRYDWLDEGLEKVAGSPLYIVFPDFAAEFGSYVPSRYKGDHADWSGTVFRALHRLSATGEQACRQVEVTKENGGFDKIVIDNDSNNFLFKNTATCIELTWSGLPEPARIEVEAIHARSGVLDQLHLGISQLVSKGRVDRCYEAIMSEVNAGRIERAQGDCVYGKVFPGKYSDGLKVKRWLFGWQGGRQPQYRGGGHFFYRGLGSSGWATLVVANIANDPYDTTVITDPRSTGDRLELRFSLRASESRDRRRYQPVDFPDMTGSLSGPSMGGDRYSGYGVDPDSTRLPGGGLASFGLREVGQSNATFSVSLVGDGGPLQFGETGPVRGNVVGKVSGLTAPMSGFCAQGGERPPIGRVDKSDEEQLRITIDTDLCRRDGGGVTVVDHVAVEVILPFGRRYFPSTAPVDVITPGLEIYIDEYYKDLAAAGVPVPDSFLGGGPAAPGDDVGPSEAASPPGTGPSGGESTGGQAACECSCEEFEKLQEFGDALEAGDADVADIQALAQCTNTCMPQYMRCAR